MAESNEAREEALARLKREGPSPESIKYLRSMKDPLTVAQIAKFFGITRQGVYHHIGGKTEQLAQKDRTSIKELRPFTVPSHQQACTLWNNITATIKYALDPTSLSDTRLRVMKNWWRTLDKNLVIVADEEEAGNYLAKCGGWRLDDRVPSDGDMIVRPHTEPTEQQRRVLSWKIIEEALKQDA
ncbi:MULTISPECIES: hypothetical protein [Streptomyces]|uniref:hypothetical protein n=1 Tax=Streptomyces TaxID=1883 RepID=UPI00345C3967